jgi:endo-1,4-beta-xylanase
MDVSIYKDDKEAKKEISVEILEKQAKRYQEIFNCFKKEAEKGYLKDVLLWGVTDNFSWKNNFPVQGRTDAPLLFDGQGHKKPAFYTITKE